MEFTIQNSKRKTTSIFVKGLFQTMLVSYSIFRELTPLNKICLSYESPVQWGYHYKDKRCEVKPKEDDVDEIQPLEQSEMMKEKSRPWWIKMIYLYKNINQHIFHLNLHGFLDACL